MATALFVCLHNAGHSRMSAALFERAAAGRHRALSAGSEADPVGRVHPQVVDVLREAGSLRMPVRRPVTALASALASRLDTPLNIRASAAPALRVSGCSLGPPSRRASRRDAAAT